MAAQQSNDTKSTTTESFAGYSRFEIELEFVQSLGNPQYLQYLAMQKYFDDEAFVRYLDYLQYFREPEYLRYLQWPGPTLRALELLQEESFRKDIINDQVCMSMIDQGWEAAMSGPSQ